MTCGGGVCCGGAAAVCSLRNARTRKHARAIEKTQQSTDPRRKLRNDCPTSSSSESCAADKGNTGTRQPEPAPTRAMSSRIAPPCSVCAAPSTRRKVFLDWHERRSAQQEQQMHCAPYLPCSGQRPIECQPFVHNLLSLLLFRCSLLDRAFLKKEGGPLGCPPIVSF